MKKILFLLIFLGLLAGGGYYLYKTDFNLIRKYVSPKIPEKIMNKIPEKIKKHIEPNIKKVDPTLLPLEVPQTEYDTNFVPNDHPLFKVFKTGVKKDILDAISIADNVNIFDITGRTPLMYSAFRDDAGITEALVKAGADINFRDRWGNTALTYAAKYGNESIVRYLVEQGAAVNVVGTDGTTPVSSAAMSGNAQILDLFLDNGADINLQDTLGFTPLMKASMSGNNAATNMLISYGANLNSKNKDGETALMLSAESGRYDTTKSLLDAGASTSARDNFGQDVLDHASKFHHDHIISLLRQYMKIEDEPESPTAPLVEPPLQKEENKAKIEENIEKAKSPNVI